MTDDEFLGRLGNLASRLNIYVNQHTDPDNPWDSDTPTLMLVDLQTARREARFLYLWASARRAEVLEELEREEKEAKEKGGPNGPPESPAESPNLSML